IQKNVLNKNTAVICYFWAVHDVKIFVLRHDRIAEQEFKPDQELQKNIETYVKGLTVNSAGAMYDPTAAKYLYDVLIKPLRKYLAGITSLIIIPAQELINVPFEPMQTEDDKYLVADYDVTYQYALPFLQKSFACFD